MRRLTEKQRESLRNKYGGHCAYCGGVLPKIWHADHFEPLGRICGLKTVKCPDSEKYTLKKTHLGIRNPENNNIENLMPSCIKCNFSKGTLSIEQWRSWLGRTVEYLRGRSGPYSDAMRFELIVETGNPIIFYFEKQGQI